MVNEVNCQDESFLNRNNQNLYTDPNRNDLEYNISNNNKKDYTGNSDYNIERQNNPIYLNDTGKNSRYSKRNILIKLKKNLFLVLGISMLLYLYYAYMRYNIVVISSRTKYLITFRVWNELHYLHDESCFKVYIYTLIFHILYVLFVITLINTSITSPGYLDQAYLENFELNEEKCYNALSGSNDENSDYLKSNEALEKNKCGKEEIAPFSKKEFLTFFEKIDKQSEENKKRIFYQLFDSLDSNNALKRVCKFCRVIKPDRSHHCRICRKCVLKYDHHCPLVNNCIGFHNYKFFFLIVFYLNIILIFVLLTSLESLSLHIQELGLEDIDSIFFLIFYLVSFISLIFSMDLLLFHIKIIYKGVTTVENLKIQNDPDHVENKHIKPETLEDSLGANAFTWFIPTYPDLKYGGYIFSDDIVRLKEDMLNDSIPVISIQNNNI